MRLSKTPKCRDEIQSQIVENSKTSGKSDERSQPRPKSLLIGKREDPGVDGEILVPDFTLTANFKMAAKENA